MLRHIRADKGEYWRAGAGAKQEYWKTHALNTLIQEFLNCNDFMREECSFAYFIPLSEFFQKFTEHGSHDNEAICLQLVLPNVLFSLVLHFGEFQFRLQHFSEVIAGFKLYMCSHKCIFLVTCKRVRSYAKKISESSSWDSEVLVKMKLHAKRYALKGPCSTFPSNH